MNIKNQPIDPNAKMADLIHNNYHLLFELNRFNIPLGFRDKTIKEVCQANKVDMDCFLAIVGFLTNPESFDVERFAHLDPISIMSYLKNSHVYFLEKRLPEIRERLTRILEGVDEVSKQSILSFFDIYYKEVREHMDYENNIVFPYIDVLINGRKPADFSINKFESHHTNIREKLTDLKNLIIKYITLPCDNYRTTNVLFDIFLSEKDLDTHCFIEDHVLIPIVKKIEKETTPQPKQ